MPGNEGSWIDFLWFIVTAIGGFTAFGYLSQTVAPSVATTFLYQSGRGHGPWAGCSTALTWRMVIAVAVIVTGICLIVSQVCGREIDPGHALGYGFWRVGF